MKASKPYILNNVNKFSIEFVVYINGHGYAFSAIDDAREFIIKVIGHAVDKECIHGLVMYTHVIESEETEE